MRPPETTRPAHTPPSAQSTAQSVAPPVASGRRRWLVGGVAALAVAGGAGLGGWMRRSGSPEAALSPAEAQLWAQSFDTPSGDTLALSRFRGRPLLVNFWATWCPPCIEELPMLDRFFQEESARGWQVLGLAIDQPSAVRAFLQKRPLGFPNALAGFGGTELGKSLGNATGALPFTVVLGAAGTVLQRKMGKVSHDDLAQWRQLR